MDSAPAAGGRKKKKKLTRKQKLVLGLLQEESEPGMSGEPAKQVEKTELQKKSQQAQMEHKLRMQNLAYLQRLVNLGYRKKTAEKIASQNKILKCKICYADMNDHKEHVATEIHKDASAFRRQCVFEARHASTLQEMIDKTDKEIAEWRMAKKEKSKQEKNDKVVNEGSLKKEAVCKEAPIVGAVDMEATNREAPDVETSNMAAPDGEGPSTEISNMIEPEGEAPSIEISIMMAPNMELSDREVSNVVAPDKESSHLGPPKETSDVGASEMRAPDESSGMGAPKKTSNMKKSDMGAPNMESSVVEAPNMGPLDKGELKMEASDEGAPDKGLSDMGAPDKGSSDMATPDEGSSDMEVPENETSNNEVPVTKPVDKEKFFRDFAVIGLEYIVEYLPNSIGRHVYACNLCLGVFSKRNIFYHVQSMEHRIFYLGIHYKGMGVSIRFQVNSRDKYKELVDCAQQVEKKYGRKSIKTANKVYVKPDRKAPQEKKKKNFSQRRRHPAPRGDLRIDRDSEFARLAFAKAVMMERDLLRARGFSRHDLDERLMEIEGYRRSGVGSMSQEDLIKRRLASDGRYPMMEKDPMMRRRYPMMELEMTMRSRASGGKYPMSQDLIMRHPSSEGQRTQDDVMEVAGLQHGFRDGRLAISREGAALHQPGVNAQTRMSQEASTMHRDANDGRFAMRPGGDMKQPAPGNVQALAFLKSLENRYSTTVTLAQELPSAMNQKLEAFQHDVVVTPLTKSDQGNTFRELKASHGNEKRGLEKSRWESTEGGIGKDPEQCEVEDFWCNDELYDFLANFVVGSKEDVEYLLEITDGFANALVRHRKRAEDIKIKIQEERKKLEEEKIAFLRDPGVRAIKKVIRAHEKEKRAMSYPAGAPVSKQARTDLSSSAKPLFPSASLIPASVPQVKPQMALSFDSYQPAGHTDSYSYGYYGYQGYNYNTSNPSSKQRPSFGAATSRPPDSRNHKPPASMAPSYNMSQRKWSSQMPPRKDTYPSRGPGDGSSAAKLPTGY